MMYADNIKRLVNIQERHTCYPKLILEFLLSLACWQGFNSNNSLLGEIGAWFSSSFNSEDLCSGNHINSILDRADSMADSASSTRFFKNLREGTEAIELNGLVSTV